MEKEVKWEDLNTIRYYEYINSIIKLRGQYNIDKNEIWEGHHIIPVCMGGTGRHGTADKNIIWLYPSEHFIAHKILAEDNKNIKSLVFAFWSMCSINKVHYKDFSEEDYNKARQVVIELLKDSKFTEEHRQHLSENHADVSGSKNPNFGNRWTEEQKKAMSEKKKGQPSPNKGKVYTEEEKYKLLLAHKDRKEVYCVELDKIFLSAGGACRKLKLTVGASNIRHACKSKSHYSGGYHWRFVNE